MCFGADSQKIDRSFCPILLCRRWLIPPGRCSHMPPRNRSWQELTWSWAYSTGSPAYDQILEAAAHAAWPYALLCAWAYLNDRDAAHALMDHAIQNTSAYMKRHPDASLSKLTARFKSVIRRRTKQLNSKYERELSFGSMHDMEKLRASEPEAEQRVYAAEVLSQLSPFARSILDWRWHGYSWREIATEVEMDHTAVRRAYLRELESLHQSLFGPGDSSKCN